MGATMTQFGIIVTGPTLSLPQLPFPALPQLTAELVQVR
jgi:hypothetical protein